MTLVNGEESVSSGASPLTVADCPATSSMLPVMVSVASLVGCIYVIVTYCYVRALRQHPAGIMFGMSVYGAIYQFLYLLDRSSARVECSHISIFVDFFLTGQETYMLIFAIDLLMALKNPFSASKGRMKQYHVFGGLSSLVCATISHFDTRYALFGFCWMSLSDDKLNLLRTVVARANLHQNTGTSTGTSTGTESPTAVAVLSPVDAASNGTLTSGIFFALYIVVVYCTSLAAILRSWNTLAKGLPDTFMTRRRIHRHLKYYVGCYFGYWTLVLGCYALFSIMPRDTSADAAADGGVRCRIWHLLKCLLLAKGMVCSLIWTRTSNILTIIEQLREFGCVDLPPHEDSINWALRLEILTKTTAGICAAVDEAERHALVASRQSSRTSSRPGDDASLHDSSDATSTTAADATGLYNDGDDRKEWYSHVEKIVLEYRNDHRMRGPTSQGIVFKDFAPEVFRRLREESNITSTSYRTSLQQTTKERVSEGKSGAFFYFTEDRKYVVKTLREEERKFLLSILPLYYAFIKRNPNTFMTRFFGCHGVTMYGKTVYFVVMQSVFDSNCQIHERFDLKGSWVGRLEGRKPSGTLATCKFCKTEYIVGGSHGQLCHVRRGGEGNWRHQYDQVGKDLNWNRHMALPYLTARAVALQLIKDSNFLCRINCIDYSLLVGIHHRSFNVSHYSSADTFEDMLSPVAVPVRASWGSSNGTGPYRSSSGSSSAPGYATPPPPPTLKPFHQAIQGGMSVDEVHGPGIYFMGIIDMLQPWNVRKRLEHFFRVYVFFQDKNGISVVNPRQYAERFQQRVVHELIYDGRFERDEMETMLQQLQFQQHDAATPPLLRTSRGGGHGLNPSNDSNVRRSTVIESFDTRYDSTVLLEPVSSSYLSPPQPTPLGLAMRVSARMAQTSSSSINGNGGVPPPHPFGPSCTSTTTTRHRSVSQPRPRTLSTGLPEHYSLGPRLSGGLVMEPPGGFFAAAQRSSVGYAPVAMTYADASAAVNPFMRRPLAPVNASPRISHASLGRTDSNGSLTLSDGSVATAASSPSPATTALPLYVSVASGASASGGGGGAAVAPLSTRHSSSSSSSSISTSALVSATPSNLVASPMTIETSLSDHHHSYQIVHTPTFPDKNAATMSA